MRKITLIIIAVVLLSWLAVLASRHEKPLAGRVSNTSGPAFEVHVEKPLLSRPIYEVPAAMLGSHDDARFDQTSSGARIGAVGFDRVELSADGWHVLIETDSEGRIAPGTRLQCSLELGGRQLSLRCRPSEGADGYLRATKAADSDELDGEFFAEFESCEDAETGKAMDWRFPVTVRGWFVRLSPRSRRKPPPHRRMQATAALSRDGIGYAVGNATRLLYRCGCRCRVGRTGLSGGTALS